MSGANNRNPYFWGLDFGLLQVAGRTDRLALDQARRRHGRLWFANYLGRLFVREPF